jgi:hypothetical protein
MYTATQIAAKDDPAAASLIGRKTPTDKGKQRLLRD